MNLARDFAVLFNGSLSAYGTDGGGCERADTTRPDLEYLRRVGAHLEGTKPLGVYPVWDCGVRWGCVDFDLGRDDPVDVHAWNVHNMLWHVGLNAWVEVTRSGGRHVWTFASEWVPMATMRKALITVCQAVDAPIWEVNPKSFELREGQLGNYLRLPHPGALVCDGAVPQRQVMVSSDGYDFSIEQFVERAMQFRSPLSAYEAVAERYVEPKRIAVQWNRTTAGFPELRGRSKKIYEEGPLEDGDRSTAMVRLAGSMAGDGISPNEAMAVLHEVDAHGWGEQKYTSRPDGERYLEGIIEHAYSRVPSNESRVFVPRTRKAPSKEPT